MMKLLAFNLEKLKKNDEETMLFVKLINFLKNKFDLYEPTNINNTNNNNNYGFKNNYNIKNDDEFFSELKNLYEKILKNENELPSYS